MKLSQIQATLSAADVPHLERAQLMRLAGTASGKAFASDLEAFSAGAADRRDDIAAVAYTLGDSCKTVLEQLRYEFDVDQVVSVAKREKRRFFSALHAIATNSPRKADAEHYLSSLGLPRSAPKQRGTASVSSAPAPAPAAPPYFSFKLFGTSAALCISEARTRAGNQHTIQVEGATAIAAGDAKAFDWQSKIIVQLTTQECYLALALFENKLKSVRFDGHGDRHDKSLHIEFQERHYFLRMTQRGKAAVAVPVRPVDGLQIVSLLYRQLRLNDPHLEIAQIRAFTDQLAQMTNTATA